MGDWVHGKCCVSERWAHAFVVSVAYHECLLSVKSVCRMCECLFNVLVCGWYVITCWVCVWPVRDFLSSVWECGCAVTSAWLCGERVRRSECHHNGLRPATPVLKTTVTPVFPGHPVSDFPDTHHGFNRVPQWFSASILTRFQKITTPVFNFLPHLFSKIFYTPVFKNHPHTCFQILVTPVLRKRVCQTFTKPGV